ncbi:TraK domain-containing protein [Alteromonas gilva]|uniref:Type-F conjugative transfer system secretin TraK n=1 Tax=Alteromonas gilva TaxID=2987522 RepID=A0ABT5L714_9ALTE|nr:type-F conjugative transfer system secretin TraK [Alteromonas gilva]MDC8832840.1 type-F conjugative transfer system secretin TraK [Alteromonas gilva]
MKQTVLFALLAAALSQGAAAQDQSKQLPTIPIEDVRAGRLNLDQVVQAPPAAQRKNGFPTEEQQVSALAAQYNQVMATPVAKPQQNSIVEMAKQNYKTTQNYDLKPTDSILIPVGQGFMNSILTDFDMVAVKTSDKKSLLEADKGYVYATLRTDEPVSLILYEEGVPESQVSVTLIPIPAPPVIINLKVAMSQAMQAKAVAYQKQIAEEENIANAAAEQASYSDQHTKRIVELLKPVALGDLPRGFSLSNDIPRQYRKPCQVGIYQYTGQRLMGGREVIDVVLLRNDSNRVYQVREEMCLADDVIAVALFEKSYLQPGEDMELYILRNKFYEREQQRQNRRPRLTGGN